MGKALPILKAVMLYCKSDCANQTKSGERLKKLIIKVDTHKWSEKDETNSCGRG